MKNKFFARQVCVCAATQTLHNAQSVKRIHAYAEMRKMMNIKRKKGRCCIRLTAGLCILVLLVNITACAAKEDNTDAVQNFSISFSWWGNDIRHQYTMEAVEEFQNNNPEISVKSIYGSWNGYDKRMHIYMKSHMEPDVMQINYAWLQEYSADGTGFYDLREFKDYIDFSNFEEEELEYGMMNGKLNGIPIAFNTQTLFHNKSLYDSYNLEPPKTWDDLFKIAEVMGKDGIYTLGMEKKSLFFLLLAYLEQTTDAEVLDEEGNLVLTAKDIQVMLKFYKRLIKEKVVMPVGSFERNAFTSQKIAGAAAWISDASNYCTPMAETGADVVVGDYIRAPKAKRLGWYVKPATLYAISRDTSQPKEAAIFLNFLLNSREMAVRQTTEKGIPISDAAYKVLEKEEMMNGYEESANSNMQECQEEMKLMEPILENENVLDAFKEEADYYLYDKKSLDEVTEAILKEWENA